jgi:DNA-binding response OmpR family regulator
MAIEPHSLALEITHAFRLRRKLAAAEPNRSMLINVWGVGYRLCDSEARR